MSEKDIKPFFEIYSCRDLYLKALNEYEEIEKTELTSPKLLNLVFSINHLKDWVTNDKRLNENFVQELAFVFNPKKNINFSIIKVLCNGGKHFILDENNKKHHKPQIIYKGYGYGRFGYGAFGVGEPSYSVLIGKEEKNILTILNQIMVEIGEIFEKYENNFFKN